jgi:acetyl-CoA carboxylase carboxyltransferase component
MDEQEGWEPEVAELRRRTEWAERMGGPERVARQHAAGRLTARERIAQLVDPGSFHEIGALAGAATYDAAGRLVAFTPAGMVVGTGRIAGRKVVIEADDFTVRGAAGEGAIRRKRLWPEGLARQYKLPLVRLVDGTGAGGSVKTVLDQGYTYVPGVPAFEDMTWNLAQAPVVAACLGPVAGLGAARVVYAHFAVMVVGTAQFFVAGPPVVKAGLGQDVDKEALGGYAVQRAAGNIDNFVRSEAEALEQIRRFLSYLPTNVWEVPPRIATDDRPDRREAALIRAIPRSRRQPYRIRDILPMIFDRGSLFEIGRDFGGSIVTLFARLDGYPVGVLAPDPLVQGGAMTAEAADKIARFVDLCQTFHLPLVNLVDMPGIAVGIDAERKGTARRAARAIAAIYQATVPMVEVVLRRKYGVGGAEMANNARYHVRYAWPSADWGSLPVEGGLEAAFRRQLEAAADPARLRQELLEQFERARSPFRSAEHAEIEEIIDPRDTRPLLVDWVHDAYRIVPHQLGLSWHTIRP